MRNFKLSAIVVVLDKILPQVTDPCNLRIALLEKNKTVPLRGMRASVRVNGRDCNQGKHPPFN